MPSIPLTLNGKPASVTADGDTPLLDANPSPTRREIALALDDNICRCGSHARILRAVERAAAQIRQGASR